MWNYNIFYIQYSMQIWKWSELKHRLPCILSVLRVYPKQAQTGGDAHSLGIVPLAVKFSVPQKAGVGQRVSARRASHTLLMPEAVSDSEQESVSNQPVASGTHGPLIHICNDGTSFNYNTFPMIRTQMADLTETNWTDINIWL